jgi:hypothetical protein
VNLEYIYFIYIKITCVLIIKAYRQPRVIDLPATYFVIVVWIKDVAYIQ